VLEQSPSHDDVFDAGKEALKSSLLHESIPRDSEAPVGKPSPPAALCLPAYCAACDRASLTRPRAGAFVSCQKCGGHARVIPGEVYRGNDTHLFDQVDETVHAADLPHTTTLAMISDLCDVKERTHAPYRMLARLLQSLPSLRFLEPANPQEHERLVHGLGMLLAIMTARLQLREVGPSIEDRS
jgi:hypothetical protein